MSRLSQEPTLIDGKINPFFQQSEEYTPFTHTMQKRHLDDSDPAPRNEHEHRWVDAGMDDLGPCVKCVVCQTGKILPPHLKLEGESIVHV